MIDIYNWKQYIPTIGLYVGNNNVNEDDTTKLV